MPLHDSPGRRALLVLLLSTVPAAAADAPALPSSQPHVLGPLPGQLRSKLQSAFEVALERLASRPACRELYRGLEGTGEESLTVTRYLRPTARERRRLCGGRVSAFTVTGGIATRLCPSSFARLPSVRAAAVLLHEALHTAGLPEAPQVPEAMRSSEINELVSRQCEL